MTPAGVNLTERVRKVLSLAHSAAENQGHGAVEPDHIALGLIKEGEGVAATVLINQGVALDVLEREIIEQGSPPLDRDRRPAALSLSDASKHVIEQAKVDATEMGHAYVGTEHVLLALLRDTTGVTAQVLARRGVQFDGTRTEVARVLGTPIP
jgi:ATP-dependent Clp protease ATP-binding subunit ClpC